MLDSSIHQAAGLQGLAEQPNAPRLVAIASHGQQQCELPLLWSLCSAWDSLGLSTVVLDGMTCESEHRPGLLHLLTDPHLHVETDSCTGSWSIIPARQGLAQLSMPGYSNSMLASLFGNYAVILLYTSAASTAQLFYKHAAAPLLLLTPQSNATLSAYQALKQLLQHQQLRPTVANIALLSGSDAGMTHYSSIENLQHCAMTFLGYRLDATTIRVSANDDCALGDIRRLALQLLESGIALTRGRMMEVH